MKSELLFSSFPFIASKKVTLRRMTDQDLDDLWPVIGDDEVYRYMPTGAASSVYECRAKLNKAESLFKEKKAVTLGIYPGEREDRLIGVAEIFNIKKDVESAELSIILARKYQMHGYASAALRAVCGYLINTVGLNRIEAYVLPINYRGILVLERCGFKKEGTVREGFLWPDKGLVDLSLYSLLRSDTKKKSGNTSYYL